MRFAPEAELYLAYARAAMRIFAPGETPESRWESFRSATQTLREVDRPGRGLSDEFYRAIAKNYAALISGPETTPRSASAW